MAASTKSKAMTEARAKAADWFEPIKDADLEYLLGTAVPQLSTRINGIVWDSPKPRLVAAMAMELVAAAVTERIAHEL